MDNAPDYLAMLDAMTPEQLAEMFAPNQQEQNVLDQEMALADELRRSSQQQPRYSSPLAGALSGLNGAAQNVFGTYQQQKALQGQRELGERQRTDATGRMTMFQDHRKKSAEADRQLALEEFLRRREGDMGLGVEAAPHLRLGGR